QQNRAGFGNDGSVQRKRLVKGWERVATDYILADTQPIGVQHCVASPGLQVCEARRKWGRAARTGDRPGGGEPIELRSVGQGNLRDEEIVVGGQIERSRESNVDLHFLSGKRAIAAGGLHREGMDASGRNAVQGGKLYTQHTRIKHQLSTSTIPGSK